MITKIKNALSSIIGVQYNIGAIEEVPSSLSKMCKDKILELQDEIIEIEHNPIGDIEITNEDQFFIIDVKLQDMSKVYSVPNLISIKKAKDILKNNDNHIIYIFVEYEIDKILHKTIIRNIRVQTIESLDWSYLAIQNLGRGQLQIKNTADGLKFNNDVDRCQWYGELKDKAIEYYNNLILKITEYKSDWDDEK